MKPGGKCYEITTSVAKRTAFLVPDFEKCVKMCEDLRDNFSKRFNDHRSQLIGSRFFCYNSPAAAAREVFKPSTDAESLLGSI